MKPICLEFEGFGPYPQIQRVNFSDFSVKSGGLFLIQGETGAGKTVLLDGITCALYGQSSGHTRGDFKQMRCQQATDSQITRVCFEFEQGKQRYRFERTLKKKKKRNPDALADFNESFSACVWREEGWEPLEENIKQKAMNEWAEKLIGLNYQQFCQVVLLPQGQFEKFLVSESKEKEIILQTLFDNEQWKRVAERLKEQVNQQNNQLKEKEQQIKTQIGIYECETISQLEEQTQQCQTELDSHIQQEHQKSQQYKHLHQQVEQAKKLQEKFDTKIQLEQQQQLLQQQQPLIQQKEQQLFKARQADRVSTEIHLLEQANHTMNQAINEYRLARKQQEQLQQEWEAQQQQNLVTQKLQQQLEESKKLEQEILNFKEKYQNVEDLKNQIAILDSETKQSVGQLLGINQQIQTQYQQLQQQIRGCQENHQKIKEKLSLLEQQQYKLQDNIQQYKEQEQSIQQKKQKLPILQQWEQTQKVQQELKKQENILYQSLQHTAFVLNQSYLQKKQEKDNTIQQRQQLQQQIQELQQQFLQQTAVQLAATLKPDQPCPVCGSCQHLKVHTHLEKGTISTNAQTYADKLQELQNQQPVLEQQMQRLEKELFKQEHWLKQLPAWEDGSISQKCQQTLDFQQVEKTLAQWQEKKTQIATNEKQQQELCKQLQQFEGVSSQQLQQEIDSQEKAYQEMCNQRDILLGQQQKLEKVSSQQLQDLARLQEKEENLKQQASYLAQQAERWKGYVVIQQVQTTEYQGILAQVNGLSVKQTTLQEKLGQSVKGLDSRWSNLQDLEQELLHNEKAQKQLEQQIQTNIQQYEDVKERYNQSQGRLEQAEKAGRNARENHKKAEEKCQQATQKAGFESIEQCKTAICSLEQQNALQQEIDQYQYKYQQILQELQILTQELQNKMPPPIQQLQQQQAILEQELQKIRENLAVENAQQEQRKLCLKNLKQSQKEWEAQSQEFLKRREFASLLQGEKGISLARYILGKQLEIVTHQANLQLQKVHGGRYQLYRDTKIASQQKSGLDLEVEDALSGQRRSVKGLSGGEKFLVSLALSLGLSSVVQAQKGGIQIEAMFIDEGFGTLDPSSISDALDMLLSVQNSGRIVGIISHVSALRETIPCGIYVKKEKTGSKITIL